MISSSSSGGWCWYAIGVSRSCGGVFFALSNCSNELPVESFVGVVDDGGSGVERCSTFAWAGNGVGVGVVGGGPVTGDCCDGGGGNCGGVGAPGTVGCCWGG